MGHGDGYCWVKKASFAAANDTPTLFAMGLRIKLGTWGPRPANLRTMHSLMPGLLSAGDISKCFQFSAFTTLITLGKS